LDRLKVIVLLAFVAAATASLGCGGKARSAELENATPADGSARHFRFFSPSSFWNTAVPEGEPLDPASAQIVASFAAEVETDSRSGNRPWINTTDYSVPVYKVPADQPTVRVALTSRFRAPALQASWERVPLPPEARPSAGSDANLVVFQPASDRLWEFWRLEGSGRGWHASWGGAIRRVSSFSGAYGARAWPGAKTWWGSSASSLSIAGGLITFADLRKGYINHALALAVPRVRAGVFASPARRTDGTSEDPLALPEGAHLRLDPHLDLAALDLPPLTLMIARAARRYGIVVRDRARVTHFFAQDPGSLGANPYLGPGGYFEGRSPGELLATFPWSHLRLLRMKLHPFAPANGTGRP
jgi:hypothetical protein